ncbi:MAG: DUF748 domain-containing protein, partial [Magnetospirillum sp.]|nr:DUF748 domain-containing protein [Magnetospirillum sp.]
MTLIGRTVWGYEIRRRHVVLGLTGVVAALLCLAWEVLPDAGLRWGLVKGLRALGMVEVSVADTDISLFGGRLTVRKVVARPALGNALGIKDFALRFRWAPLLDKRLVLDRVAVEGIDIDLKREDGSFVLNGLPLAVAATPSVPPGTPVPAQEWGLDVASLELTNSRLHLADGDFTAEIAVERLLVENLHSRNPAVPVAYHLIGSLNGASVALDGTVKPFAAEPGFALKAVLGKVALTDFAALAGRNGIAGLHGQADLTLDMQGAVTEAATTVKASGRLVLDDLGLDAPVTAHAAHVDLDLRRLDWDGARAELSAALDVATLAVTAPGGSGAAAKLALDVRQAEWNGTRLSLAAHLDGTALSGRGEAGGNGAAASLELEAEALSFENQRLSWRGRMSLAGGHVAVAGVDAGPESLAWVGRLDVDTAQASGRAEGKLDLGGQRLAVTDTIIGHKRASAEGWVEFGAATTAQIKLDLDGLTVRDGAKSMDWAALDHLEAMDLALAKDGGVRVGRLGVDGLNALRKDGKGAYPWRFEARRLRLEQAGRDGDGDVTVAEARLDGLVARLTRTGDGFLGFMADKGKEPKAQKAGDEPDYSLGKLVLSGDSRVHFEDRSLPDPVRLEVRPLDLTLGNLDTETPERDIPFDLKLGIGRSTIALAGNVRPFAAELSGRVDGQIKAFELPPLSPYLADALGVQLQSGHFDGTLGLGAARGKLSGALDVALSNLFIAPPDPNAPLSKKAEMPIETVLDLLRDGDDRIHLSLPIRGDTANPDLDISDAVAQAVAGALKSTMLTTLKLAFPVAALI